MYLSAIKNLQMFRFRLKKCVSTAPNGVLTTNRRYYSSHVEGRLNGDKRMERLFLDDVVQTSLAKLTKMDLDRVYKATQQDALHAPKYQLYSDQEVDALLGQAKSKAKEKLQMPPYVCARQPIDDVISVDPELQGFADTKHLFIDIGSGSKDRDRLIVVREPDGVLRSANWEERQRMNQIYFPTPGRELVEPAMFRNMSTILERGEYEFALNRACVQFDPDDPRYIELTNQIYEHCNQSRRFDALLSTRHYGPLVFYLVSERKIDNLLLDAIEKEWVEEATLLVKLFHIAHPDCESATNTIQSHDQLDFLMNFVSRDSAKKGNLELAIQTLRELRKQTQHLQDGVRKAHGQ